LFISDNPTVKILTTDYWGSGT